VNTPFASNANYVNLVPIGQWLYTFGNTDTDRDIYRMHTHDGGYNFELIGDTAMPTDVSNAGGGWYFDDNGRLYLIGFDTGVSDVSLATSSIMSGTTAWAISSGTYHAVEGIGENGEAEPLNPAQRWGAVWWNQIPRLTEFTASAGGGTGAPTDASYVVMGLDATLTDERLLSQSTGIIITDGGAGGNVSVGINDGDVAMLTGSIFSGEVITSGNLQAVGGLSGSLQQLTTGESYLAGTGTVTIISQSNGQIIISGTGDGGADVGASYVVMGVTGSLPNERALTQGTGVIITDGGAGAGVTVGIDDSVVATLTGSVFSGPVSAALTGSLFGDVIGNVTGSVSGTLTGSLTELTPGVSYLVGAGTVSILSQSNGQIIISGTGDGGGSGGDGSGTLLSSSVLVSSLNVWENAGDLPEGRIGASFFVASDKIWMIGGQTATFTATNHILTASINDPLTWGSSSVAFPGSPVVSYQWVVDGKAYIAGGTAGGINYDTIWSASLGDLENWSDTGATLPSAQGNLASQHLAIANDKIWIFMGYDGGGASDLDTIYTASLSDPTDWGDSGATFPAERGSGGFYVVDGNAYLVCGQDTGVVNGTDDIYVASTDDLTTWETLPARFPAELGLCHAAVAGDTVYVFGGRNASSVVQDEVWAAPVSNPTNFQHAGHLPLPTFIYNVVQVSGSAYIFGHYDTGYRSDIFRSTPTLSASVAGTVLDNYGAIPVTTADGTQTTHRRSERVGINEWFTNLGTGSLGYTPSATTGGGVGGSDVDWVDNGTQLRTTSSVAIDSDGGFAEDQGDDVYLYVSGTIDEASSSARIAVFGGDVRISGSLSVGTGSVKITNNDIQFGGSPANRLEYTGEHVHLTSPFSASSGLTGSLQQVGEGIPYLVGQGTVTITSQSNGQLIISGTGDGGSGGAGGSCTSSSIAYHDTTHDPIGLWQLSGTMLDSSGNGYDLVLSTGTERYTDIAPGLRGFDFDGATRIQRAGVTAALAITGTLTIEALVRWNPDNTNLQYLIAHNAAGDVDGTENYLYSIATDDAVAGSLDYFAERTAAGSNISYTIDDRLPHAEVSHLALTRDASGDIKFYLNGKLLGSGSSGLLPPTDGSAGIFKVGANESGGTTFFNGSLSSLKILDIELTAAQVEAEFERTLGPLVTAVSCPGSNGFFRLPVLVGADETSTALSSSKKTIGATYFNPTLLATQGDSPIYWWRTILRTSETLVSAAIDLYDVNGIVTGLPGIITGSILSSSNQSPTFLEVDLSTELSSVTGSGVFEARIWKALSGSVTSSVACYNAGIELEFA
jgi:hypothetical protein